MTFQSCLFHVLQEGDKVPSVDLFEDSPANKINIADLCANKKVALFAVPGKLESCMLTFKNLRSKLVLVDSKISISILISSLI